jgi:hypothetical protein
MQIPITVRDLSTRLYTEEVMKLKIGFTDSYTRPLFDSELSGEPLNIMPSEMVQILFHERYIC